VKIGGNKKEGEGKSPTHIKTTTTTTNLLSPKQYLYHRFNVLENLQNNNNNSNRIVFDTKSIPSVQLGGSKYTSSVYWPFTDEWFHSGIFTESSPPSCPFHTSDKNIVTTISISPQIAHDVDVLDNCVYYQQKKLAEQAAAARAIDCLFHRARGGSSSSSKQQQQRLCYEEPYDLMASSTAPFVDYSLLLSSIGNNSDDEQKEGIFEDVENYILNEKDSSSLHSEDIKEKEEEEEEYMIVHLPGTGSINHNGPSSTSDTIYNADYSTVHSYHHNTQQKSKSKGTTMERILEAWADAPPLHENPDKTASSISIEGEEGIDEEGGDANAIIENALAWYEIMRKRKHFSVSSSNAILNILANADDDIVERYLELNHHKDMKVVKEHKDRGGRLTTNTNAYGGNDEGNDYNDMRANQDGLNEKEKNNDLNHEPRNVEELANQILRGMLSSNDSDDDNSHQEKQVLNTDTCNAYIRCLRRSTLIQTAQAAESILNDMINGRGSSSDLVPFLQGHNLPSPDIGVYNVVMDLWVKVGDVNDNLGKRKISEIYDQLETQRIISIKEEEDETISTVNNDVKRQKVVRPNRETFLIVLSSLAKSSSLTFCADEARYWIEQMKQHANEYNDISLQPDTEVYNAPLKWSGGKRRRKRFSNDVVGAWAKLSSSSSYSWDDYGQIFQEGFRIVLPEEVASDESLNVAKQMEDWLIGMEEMAARKKEEGGKVDVAPDIETYESIIQAWVRTGTLEGLLKAEGWANRSINDGIIDAEIGKEEDCLILTSPPPRLQMFHPIVAAWTYCRHDRGPVRVKEWIDRLEELGRDKPELRPDGRVRSALIFAWKRHQTHIMRQGEIWKRYSRLSSEGLESCNGVGVKKEEEFTDITTNKRNGVLSTAELSFSAAKKCASSLEELCSQLRKQLLIVRDDVDHDNCGVSEIFIDGSVFLHVVDAWKDSAVAFAVAEHTISLAQKKINHRQEDARKHIKSQHALSEMFNTVRLLDDFIEIYCNLIAIEKSRADAAHGESDNEELLYNLQLQLQYLLGISFQVHSTAVSGLRQIDTATSHLPYQSTTKNSASNFVSFFPRVEMMLRRSFELQQMVLPDTGGHNNSLAGERADVKKSNLQCAFEENTYAPSYSQVMEYDDLFSYEKNNIILSSNDFDKAHDKEYQHSSRYQLYSEILKGSTYLNSPRDYGSAVRVAMYILDNIEEMPTGFLANGIDTKIPRELDLSSLKQVEDLSILYQDMISLVGSIVSNRHERLALISRVCSHAKDFYSGRGAYNSAWKNATSVDREPFLLAIRNALNDSEMAEMLLRDLIIQKKAAKKRRRVANKRRYRRSH